MIPTNYYLITCLNWKREKVNFAITTNRDKAKNFCKEYTERKAQFKKIPDFKAIDLLLTNNSILFIK